MKRIGIAAILLMLAAGGTLIRHWLNAFAWGAIAVGMIFFTGVALINGFVMHALALGMCTARREPVPDDESRALEELHRSGCFVMPHARWNAPCWRNRNSWRR